MKIASNTSVIEKLTKILKPVIKLLFPQLKNNNEIQKEVSMNIIANILGLGNAATPLGLKAMKSMQKENKKKGYFNRFYDDVSYFKYSFYSNYSYNCNCN